MARMMAKEPHRSYSPSRCERCGCMMVMIRMIKSVPERDPLGHVGWQCLICGKTVDRAGMAHRHERGEALVHTE